MSTVSPVAAIAAMDRPRAVRRRNMPLLAGGTVAAASLVVWLIAQPSERTLRVDASKITIEPVTAASFQDFIPLRGQVVPLDSIVLDAVLGGRVEEVFAEAGQRVAAGQPLIRLSDATLELNAIAGETQVIQQINAQRSLQLSFETTKTSDARAVADADYNLQRLNRDAARRQPLLAKGYETQEAVDKTSDELNFQRRMRDIAADAMQRDLAVIKRSEALIDQTAARLDDNLAAAKRQLDALTVRAPADGVLTALEAHVGEQKLRGQNLGQLDRDNGFKVTVPIDEFYLARVKTGQIVTATIDGVPNTLTVGKIYPQVKDGKFDIDLAWNSSVPAGLRRGQAVQGKLDIGGGSAATVLPVGPFLEASGGNWAFVATPDGGAAERRPIKLGKRTTEMVEVLGGLRPGDRVVTSDYTGLDRIEKLVISH
jgi:HlyD family secretion protein